MSRTDSGRWLSDREREVAAITLAVMFAVPAIVALFVQVE